MSFASIIDSYLRGSSTPSTTRNNAEPFFIRGHHTFDHFAQRNFPSKIAQHSSLSTKATRRASNFAQSFEYKCTRGVVYLRSRIQIALVDSHCSSGLGQD